MARRSRAREVALQLLFQRDQNPTPVPRAALERFVRDRLLGDTEMSAYCLALHDGTLAHQGAIDSMITASATNWRLSRMQPADRSVLRMATYELLHDSNPQPLEVIIHEAIELARRFGSADSSGFINGVLDRVAKSRNAERETEDVEPTPAADAPSETPMGQ
jgi:N utilization substance protein B